MTNTTQEVCVRCTRPRWEHDPIHKIWHPYASKEDAAYVRVYHSGYGCDTGCCGHIVQVCTEDGTELLQEDFAFSHPYGVDHEEFARELAGPTLQACGVPLRFDECEIIDD